MDLPRRRERSQAAACQVCVAPMGDGQAVLDARRGDKGVAGPGEEGVALADDPVTRAVEVEDGEGGVGRFGGDQGGDGRGGGDALVEERQAEGGS